jgi:hypothetical protein
MHLSRFRPRFTVRRLLIAVAMVGLLMGAGRWVVEMRTRSADYRERAYAFAETRGHARLSDFFVTTKNGRVVSIHEDENFWIEHMWARELANKYWRLADRPWLPVEADPPRPKPLAHPRPAVDCPAELPSFCAWRRYSYVEPVYPWWTFLWTWRNERFSVVDPRWSFP